MDADYLARVTSLCVPAFYFDCVAAVAMHSADPFVAAIAPFYCVGALLLLASAAVRCLFARIVSMRLVFTVGSALLALIGAVCCFWGRLWVSPVVMYILLWGIGLQFCANALVWCAGLSWTRRLLALAAMAVLACLGGALGAFLAPRIDSLVGLQDLVFAGLAVGSVLELLLKMRLCMAAGPAKGDTACLGEGSQFAQVSEPPAEPVPVPAADPPLASDAPTTAREVLAKYDDMCRWLIETFQLTKREGDVLFFVARGYKAAYCARELGIAETTVRSHIRSIYSKTGVYTSDGLISMVESYLEGEGRRAPTEETSRRRQPARPRR